MQNVHLEDLNAWATRFGVDLSQADLEQMGSLAEQYLERVNVLRELDLEGEPLWPAPWGEEARA